MKKSRHRNRVFIDLYLFFDKMNFYLHQLNVLDLLSRNLSNHVKAIDLSYSFIIIIRLSLSDSKVQAARIKI